LSLTWDTNPRQRLKASGGSQPRIKEGASHHARRGKNAEAFLIDVDCAIGMEWEANVKLV